MCLSPFLTTHLFQASKQANPSCAISLYWFIRILKEWFYETSLNRKYTPPETDKSPLKDDGFAIGISEIAGGPYFQGITVSFREGNTLYQTTYAKDDGPKANPDPEKPDPAPTPSKKTSKKPEDVAKAQVAFEVPQKTEMLGFV